MKCSAAIFSRTEPPRRTEPPGRTEPLGRDLLGQESQMGKEGKPALRKEKIQAKVAEEKREKLSASELKRDSRTTKRGLCEVRRTTWASF